MLKSILRLSGATIALAPAALQAATVTTANTGTSAHEPDYFTIVVTATPLEKPLRDVLAPVSVVEGEELQRQMRESLGETLRREPGITSTGYTAGASRPIIRGLTGDRVRTLVNGIGTIDAAAASPDHATPVEPALAEKIEIVRGTALLRYGSSAAGGVVNVFDGRIPSEVPEGGLDASARAGYTTVDEGTEFAAGVNALIGSLGGVDIVFSAAGSVRDADDYDIPGFAESAALRELEEMEEDHDHDDDHGHDDHGHEDEDEGEGTLENSFNEVDVFSAGLSFIGDRGFLGFSVQQYESSYGIPAGHDHGHGHDDEEHAGDHAEEHGDGHGEDGVFIELEQTRFDVNGSLELGGFFERADLFAGFADYEHIEFEGPGERGTVFANEGYEIRLEGIQQQIGNWRGATGFQFRNREFSAIGDEAFVPPTETNQFGLFTFQEVTLGQFLLEGAARYENTRQERIDSVAEVLTIENGAIATTGGVDERTFDTFSVTAGGRYAFNDALSASVQLLRTERAPTTEELFSNGPHLATQAFEIGNQDLDKEIATGVEAGLRFSNDVVSLAFNWFYTDYTDFIFEQNTGLAGDAVLVFQGEDDPEELEEFEELLVFEFAQQDATFHGFEVEAFADLGTFMNTDFSVDLVADWVDANFDDPAPGQSENVPRIPPLGVIVGANAVTGPLSFRAEAEYANEAEDTAAFELPTESFTLVNLYADWSVTENVYVSLAALNIGDEEARNHASFVKDEVPMPGRNFRFAVGFRY